MLITSERSCAIDDGSTRRGLFASESVFGFLQNTTMAAHLTCARAEGTSSVAYSRREIGAMERTRASPRVAAPVTAELMAHALREAVKFLLFVRQQMPSSYDELRTALLDTVGADAMGLQEDGQEDGQEDDTVSPGSSKVSGKRKRVTSVERAATKLFREIESMVGCLTPELLEAHRPERVALFLGSTPNRPKEMFVFELNSVQRNGYTPWVQTPEATRVVGNAGRRLVRECLPAVAQCPPGATTKAFLMFKAKSTTHDGTTKQPSNGFLPKRGFEPNTKHTKVSAEFDVGVKGDDDVGTVNAPSEKNSDSESIWFQCQTAVKGLKTLKGVVGL